MLSTSTKPKRQQKGDAASKGNNPFRGIGFYVRYTSALGEETCQLVSASTPNTTLALRELEGAADESWEHERNTSAAHTTRSCKAVPLEKVLTQPEFWRWA